MPRANAAGRAGGTMPGWHQEGRSSVLCIPGGAAPFLAGAAGTRQWPAPWMPPSPLWQAACGDRSGLPHLTQHWPLPPATGTFPRVRATDPSACRHVADPLAPVTFLTAQGWGEDGAPCPAVPRLLGPGPHRAVQCHAGISGTGGHVVEVDAAPGMEPALLWHFPSEQPRVLPSSLWALSKAAEGSFISPTEVQLPLGCAMEVA